MRILITLLIMVAVGSAWWFGRRQGKAESVDSRVSALPSATEAFNLRSRCAELQGKILKDNPASPVINPSSVSHYDFRTSRCFVELDNNYSRRVFDGQTGERLAELWNGPIKSAYLKDVKNASWDATLAFIDSRMRDDRQ
jgi:hypothetical protein